MVMHLYLSTPYIGFLFHPMSHIAIFKHLCIPREILWLPTTILAMLYLASFFAKPGVKPPQNLCIANRRPCEVDIVLVTRGTRDIVEVLREVLENTVKVHLKGRRYLLTEPDADSEVVSLAKHYGFEIIIVPKWWHKGVAKGRAIWYFSEYYAENHRWYLILDDDSYPMDSHFHYEVCYADYYGFNAGNMILIPRPGKCIICWLADMIRIGHDLTSYRVSHALVRKPIFGMHGEGLLVKGYLLKKYWKTITIAEDSEFGFKAWKEIKLFQSRSRISILSPNSIGDFIKQRSRWFRGLIQALYAIPRSILPIQLLVMTSWLSAIASNAFVAWILIPLLRLGSDPNLSMLVTIATFMVFYMYIAGFIIVCRQLGIPKISILVGIFLIPLTIPFFGILEGLGALFGVLRHRSKVFHIIDKRLHREELQMLLADYIEVLKHQHVKEPISDVDILALNVLTLLSKII